MIILPPYEYDSGLYHKVPLEDRWIFNKLAVAERMGYDCGPSGTFPVEHGRYCLRPTNSIQGMGYGGWYDINYAGEGADLMRPGYFWCEWFEGEHSFVEYVNDRFSAGLAGTMDEATELLYFYEMEAVPLEPEFRDISRYMLVERIGGKVIEASTRLMGPTARHKIMEQYRKIDPTYDPYVEYGNYAMRRVTNTAGGYEWIDAGGERTPWGE